MAKLVVVVGENVRVECEAAEDFLSGELDKVIQRVIDPLRELAELETRVVQSPGGQPKRKREQGAATLTASTSQVATTLGVNSGGELIRAAAAKLHFVDGKETFSRSELIDEMKSASMYFKGTYISNLSKYLQTAVRDGTLNEQSPGVFAISVASRKSLGQQLAELSEGAEDE